LRIRWLTRHTHAIVTVSATTADAMCEKQGIPRKRISVIPNGIAVLTNLDCADSSTPAREELRRGLKLLVDGFVIGSVGRFAPEKNYPLLVGAFAAFHRRHPESCLVLVGDGPERGAIETAIKAAGIESACRLPGMQSDVAPWLQAMDLFCLTSLTEGVSVALLEAGAYGVPAVATAVGGNVEIIENGVTGLLVDPGSHPSVTDAFERLHEDVDLRAAMGKKAREKVALKYSQRATLDMYERLYGEG
jgi:glycosyltransferase involved in cell wall biosynthesis